MPSTESVQDSNKLELTTTAKPTIIHTTQQIHNTAHSATTSSAAAAATITPSTHPSQLTFLSALISNEQTYTLLPQSQSIATTVQPPSLHISTYTLNAPSQLVPALPQLTMGSSSTTNTTSSTTDSKAESSTVSDVEKKSAIKKYRDYHSINWNEFITNAVASGNGM